VLSEKRQGEFGRERERESEIKESKRKDCSKKGSYVYKWALK